MEIQTTLNYNTLHAINKLWTLLEFEDSFHGRIHKSIVEYTAAKFLKKQVGRMGKRKDKDFTMSLYPFELAVIQIYLRATALIWFPSTSLEYHQVTNYCNQIHQKTS